MFEDKPERDKVTVGADIEKGEPEIFEVYPESVVTWTIYVIVAAEPPVGWAQFKVKPLEVILAEVTELGIAGQVMPFPVNGPVELYIGPPEQLVLL